MSVLLRPMGYLAAFAATVRVTGCGSEINGQRICHVCQAKEPPPYKDESGFDKNKFKGE